MDFGFVQIKMCSFSEEKVGRNGNKM
jgi:hypothetical protein